MFVRQPYPMRMAFSKNDHAGIRSGLAKGVVHCNDGYGIRRFNGGSRRLLLISLIST
jgi:hypothetical protein